MQSVKRFLPLLIIMILFISFFALDGHHYLHFEMLKTHHDALESWKSQHYVLATITFVSIYILAVSISIPGAVILTLLGGFLFGPIIGTLLVVFSATIGAILLFLATKSAVGDLLAKKAGPFIKKMEAGFQENALNYLLFLRLVPLFPFWLVNIVPALLEVRLSTFIFGTFLGIIPGSFVYVLVGNGLGGVIAHGKTPDLGIILSLPILAPLIGLGLLSVLPLVIKHFRKKAIKNTS